MKARPMLIARERFLAAPQFSCRRFHSSSRRVSILSSFGWGLTAAGMTIPEVAVALCVMAMGFVGAWTSAGQSIRMAQKHRETIAATETLLRRVEACRAMGWSTVTSAQGIQQNILQTPACNACYLSNLAEQITVTPYPPVSPAPTPIVVQRLANGSVQIVSSPPAGFYLRSVLAVRVDFQATWVDGPYQTQQTRQNSTVISMEGLLQ